MSKRGTAAMSPENRRIVAQKGGIKTSQDKAHMAKIGRLGGLKSSQDKEHMAALGRKGGKASAASKKAAKEEAREPENLDSGMPT